jgi:hypothetical protein
MIHFCPYFGRDHSGRVANAKPTIPAAGRLLRHIGRYFAVHGGMGRAMDWMFSSMQGEVEKMFTKEVSPVQKANFKAEMKTMRDSVRQNRLPMDRLQPLLRTMQNAIEDEHVTPAEADQLTKEMHAINTGRLKPAAPQKK